MQLSDQLNDNFGISGTMRFDTYREQVEKHVDFQLSDDQIETARENYMADYSVHETAEQLM